MMKLNKRCQLTFFTIVLLSSSLVCGAVLGCVGEVSPPDPFLFEGETLNLTCGLTTACHKRNSSLHFTYYPPDVNSTRHCGNISRITRSSRILADFITRVNESHIRLVIPNVTVEDSGDYCCVQSENGLCEDRLAKQIVTVEYNMKEVTSMHCVNQDWLHLDCPWKHQVKYKCPELIKVNRSSTCSLNGIEVNDNCTISFRVTHDKRGDQVKESNFTINTYDYVKPNRVKDLTVISVNSTCVNISWNVNTFRTLSDLKFIIRYKTSVNWATSKTNLTSKTTIVNWTQCRLQPYTNYTFRVVVRPESNGYESEPADYQVQTSEDLPTAAPETCRGCFHQFPCPQNTLQQCVTVYWKDLPETKKRGQIKYLVVLNNDVRENTTKTWATFRGLENSTSDARVVISTSTEVGRGLKNRTMILFHKRPNPPDDLVVEDNGTIPKTYLLSWKDSNRNTESYKNMTFVWCFKKSIDRGEGCEINWKRVNTPAMSYTLSFDANTSRFIEDSGISIGISSSVRFPGDVSRSSGIVWSACIYHYNQRPKKAPTLLHTKGTTVSWEIEPCPNAYITGFSITCCPTLDERTCHGSPTLVPVSGSVREYKLKDIAVDTKYLVSIEALSRNGKSDPSNPTVVLLDAPQQDPTAWYTMAAVLGFLMVVAVISTITWLSYKSKAKYKSLQLSSKEATVNLPINQDKVKAVNNDKNHDLSNLLKNFFFFGKKAPSKRDILCLDTSSDSGSPLIDGQEHINVLTNELENKQIPDTVVMDMQNCAPKEQEHQNEKGNETSEREQTKCDHFRSNGSQEAGIEDKSSNKSYMMCTHLGPCVQDNAHYTHIVRDGNHDTPKGVSDADSVHEAHNGVSDTDSGHEAQLGVSDTDSAHEVHNYVTVTGSCDDTHNCVLNTDSVHEVQNVVSDTETCHDKQIRESHYTDSGQEAQACVTNTSSCDDTQNCVSDTDSGHEVQNVVSDTETCHDKQIRESHYTESGQDNERCGLSIKNSLRTIEVCNTSEFIRAGKGENHAIPGPSVNAYIKDTSCSSIASIIVSAENPEYVRMNFSDSANT